MPLPKDWREVGVPEDIPTLVSESALCRALSLSPYAGYRLRRLGIITPVARTRTALLYSTADLEQLEAFRVDVGGRSYLGINELRIW